MPLTRLPVAKRPWLQRAGLHSAITSAPANEDERLVFALLEAIGYQCWKYGDAPNFSESEAKAWLKMNAAAIFKMPAERICPDYLTLFTGGFDFLRTDPPPETEREPQERDCGV